MQINERIASYLAYLTRQCKSCHRKSESSCRMCPIQPAAGLLRDLTSSESESTVASRRLQRKELRAAILLHLQQSGAVWIRAGALYQRLLPDFPGLTYRRFAYALQRLPIEQRGGSRKSSVRLQQPGDAQ